jgi:hypothetical protein
MNSLRVLLGCLLASAVLLVASDAKADGPAEADTPKAVALNKTESDSLLRVVDGRLNKIQAALPKDKADPSLYSLLQSQKLVDEYSLEYLRTGKLTFASQQRLIAIYVDSCKFLKPKECVLGTTTHRELTANTAWLLHYFKSKEDPTKVTDRLTQLNSLNAKLAPFARKVVLDQPFNGTEELALLELYVRAMEASNWRSPAQLSTDDTKASENLGIQEELAKRRKAYEPAPKPKPVNPPMDDPDDIGDKKKKMNPPAKIPPAKR